MANELYDVVIIGGGPAGLSCALYTARAKLSTVILDKAPGAGALAVTTRIANYPGVSGPVSGDELLNTMREQALSFGAEYAKVTVQAADVLSDPKVWYTPEHTYHGKTVVIATGARGRHEKIEGEGEFTGRGVSYCVTCDAAFFTDKDTAVVGYDEVALEEALFLTRFARMVHLVCPKSRLSAPVDVLNEVMAAPKITVHTSLEVTRIVGEQFVSGIVVKNGSGAETILSVEGVFMLLSGTAPVTDFIGGALKVLPEGCIEADCHAATDVPGVYAVGDVTCLHPNQAIIAAAEGVIAALSIDKFLTGRERTKVDYM